MSADRNWLFGLFPCGYPQQVRRQAGMFRPGAWSAGSAIKRLVGQGGDAERSFEGEINAEGGVSIWSKWAVLGPNASTMNPGQVNPAQLSGTFSEGQFRGSMFANHKYMGTCATEFVMTRVGSQVASGNADAERQRLAAEVARLKAEAIRPAATATAPRVTNEAVTILWNEVRDARPVDEMQRYLEAYPAGEYAPLVLAHIRQLAAAEAQRAELTLWNQVKGGKDAAGFKRYVVAYPDGLFVDVAKARILSFDSASIETAAVTEKTLWRLIDASRKASDYKNYLAKYPDGRFRKQAEAGIQIAEKLAAIEGIDFGDYHALIIGNNAYKNLPQSKAAAADAQAVAEALKSTYGFKVKRLTDASRNDIIDALDTYVETLTERDNLLIYCAGHGWLSEDAGRGYW